MYELHYKIGFCCKKKSTGKKQVVNTACFLNKEYQLLAGQFIPTACLM